MLLPGSQCQNGKLSKLETRLLNSNTYIRRIRSFLVAAAEEGQVV